MNKTPRKDVIVVVQRKGRKPEEWKFSVEEDDEAEKLATRLAKSRGWKDVEKIKAKGKP